MEAVRKFRCSRVTNGGLENNGGKEGSHEKYVISSTYSCPGAPQILFTRVFTADSYLYLHFKDEKMRPRKVLYNLQKSLTREGEKLEFKPMSL